MKCFILKLFIKLFIFASLKMITEVTVHIVCWDPLSLVQFCVLIVHDRRQEEEKEEICNL